MSLLFIFALFEFDSLPCIVRYDSDDKDDKYRAKQRANLKAKSP